MSKSLGNFISWPRASRSSAPRSCASGAAAWTTADNISVNQDYLKTGMVDAYRRIRNTFRFLLGNTADFDPARHAVDRADMLELDRWALDELARLESRVTEATRLTQFHRVYGQIHNFCAVDHEQHLPGRAQGSPLLLAPQTGRRAAARRPSCTTSCWRSAR